VLIEGIRTFAMEFADIFPDCDNCISGAISFSAIF
jgi:hypothetical protein